MGGAQSREGLDLTDSEDESGSDYSDATPDPAGVDSGDLRRAPASAAGLDDVDAKLRSLKLKYSSPSSSASASAAPDAVKLYVHVGGTSPTAKWVLSDGATAFSFSSSGEGGAWRLVVGTRVDAEVGPGLQLKPFPEKRRVDFVAAGSVWALKFLSPSGYIDFRRRFEQCLFENTYGVVASNENREKIFGKDFKAWAKPEEAEDAIWEDAEGDSDSLSAFPFGRGRDLLEEFEEDANGGAIQSLALGALDNSFLVGDSTIQVVRNFRHGVHGKGMSVKIKGRSSGSGNGEFSTPNKALLMRGETNMVLMSPEEAAGPHSTGVHQVDIETGKVVTEWKFEKDGAEIAMRDITNDSKGAQLDKTGMTFLGLDDNRLCRWDMRDPRGRVQSIADSAESPVLQWSQGHQFSRGTNFQCFATTGDGSIVVGSLDGKIRLYSTTSMRMAKTAFPGLGSPITHVDVTYDGKWILGTTDTYLILICTIFIDKDGKEKTGFAGRMGNRIAAPRLLKLTPLDSHLAGSDNKFHGGQFSWVTENGKQERHLVATVGKFSVIWDFQQVKNSKHECYQNQEGLKSCYCYKIVLKDMSIVDSRFMHEKFATGDSPEAPLVVATPTKVTSFSLASKR